MIPNQDEIKVTYHPRKTRKKRSDAGIPRKKTRKTRSDAGKKRKTKTFLDHLKKMDKMYKDDKVC